ncbi:hypothetical protein [Pseudomonas protegens]|uniref:hypothetical protein n=1 Tax=Pseudomonas protegens TaxID=380021 RepID=UPI0022643C59|nr:hypothetical protein [Pseudomonas protegens]
MKIVLWVLLCCVLAGCASAPRQKSQEEVFSDVASAIQQGRDGSPQFQDALPLAVTRINSHGVLPDRLMIVAGGGMERFGMRDMFRMLSAELNRKLVIFGANPALDKAIVGGALSDQQFPRVWVFFVGEPAQEQEMRAIVETAGSKYSFISKYQE